MAERASKKSKRPRRGNAGRDPGGEAGEQSAPAYVKSLERERDRLRAQLQEAQERLDEHAAHARVTEREAVDLEHEQQPDLRLRHRLADARGVRKHDAALEQFQFVGGDFFPRVPLNLCGRSPR